MKKRGGELTAKGMRGRGESVRVGMEEGEKKTHQMNTHQMPA